MSRRPRRTFTPEFKARAVLDVLVGTTSQAEVCRKHQISPSLFALWKTTFLQRLPVPDRDRLVYVQREKNGGVFPYPMYTALRDGTQAFAGMAAWSGFVASPMNDPAFSRVARYSGR